MKVYIDTYTRVLLTIIAVLLTVVGARLWLETPPMVSTAQAVLPDAGLQRKLMVQELQHIRTEIATMSHLLRTGPLKVQIIEPGIAPPHEAPGDPLATQSQIGR